MLENKPATTKRKSLLQHTPGWVENQVDRETIIQDVKKEAESKKKVAEKTTSIRISVYTRNGFNSLVTLGEADTVNDLVEQLITQKIESLRPDQQHTYDIIIDVASKRDTK